MKTTARILSVFFALFLLTAAVPMGAYADEELTVVSVTAEDLTLFECTSGQWVNINQPNEWYRYSTDRAIFTVTYSDGSSERGTVYELSRQFGSGAIRVVATQSVDAPWGVGDHTATFTCGSINGSFTITIAETPVASIVAAPATAVYHVDGYYTSYTDPETGTTQKNAWFYYTVNTPYVTVTYKDGTSISGTPDEIRAQTGYAVAYRLTQSYGDELVIGDNTEGVIFMGVEAPFVVTVVDLIDGVEWVKLPDKRTYFYGEQPDLSGGVLRIRYTDDTFEDVPIEKATVNPSVTVARLNETFQLQNRTPSFNVTSSDMSFTLWDNTLTDTVSVRPIPTEVTLSADENHALTLTIDGTPLKLLDFDYSSFTSGFLLDWEETTGTLYTDGGMLTVTFKRDRNNRLTVSLGDDLLIDVYAVSNQVEDGSWVESVIHAECMAYSLNAYRGNTRRFDGVVTADNIDNLLRIAIQMYTDFPNMTGDYSAYYQMPKPYAEQLINEAYGVTFDMTQSSYYNAESDTLQIPKSSDGRSEAIHYAAPVYSNGAWRAVMYSNKQTVYTFSMDDDFRLIAHDIRQVGDVSGDDALDMRDAFALYNAASGGAELSDVQTAFADMNTDGELDMRDAFALYAIASGE